MTTDPEQRVFLAARIVAVWRAHPALALVVAVLAVAAAVATVYITRANIAQPAPATTAYAPIIKPGITLGSAENEAKARAIVWRDEAGAIYRAKVGGARFEQFLRQRRAALEAARSESRDQAAAEILAALKPVFAEMTARVPGYADWYFGYLTKYELMAHALIPALDYLGSSLDVFSGRERQHKSLVQAIGPYVVAYLEEQYAERVVRPREAEVRLSAAFDKSYDALQARWESIVEEERGAIRAFIKEEAGLAERLSADQALGLELDWDGSREHGSAMHEEGMIDKSFRRGLLSLRLKIPKIAKAQAQPDIKENTAEEADDITHVIVNLFDKLVGAVVSQMSDLAIGVFAGSAASGTTVGFGIPGTPAVLATGVVTAVPIGAAIGLAATVVAEMLSNRLEESLNRAEFEESLRRTVDAMGNAIGRGMISVLQEHVEGRYADIVHPVAVK
jgi:hypothetical protein